MSVWVLNSPSIQEAVISEPIKLVMSGVAGTEYSKILILGPSKKSPAVLSLLVSSTKSSKRCGYNSDSPVVLDTGVNSCTKYL